MSFSKFCGIIPGTAELIPSNRLEPAFVVTYFQHIPEIERGRFGPGRLK